MVVAPPRDTLRRNNVVVRGDADGRVIVFAHGFGCSQDTWSLVAPHFEADHRVVLFDHVGAGGSDSSAYDRGKYDSLDGYADDVLEILEDLDARDVVFVGHSVSAMIGVLAANRDPSRFGDLVLIGPSPRYVNDGDYVGGFEPEDITALLDALDANHLGWSAHMGPVIVGNPDRPALGEQLTTSLCSIDPEIVRHFARVTFLSDNRDDLGRVTVPTLIMQCSDDVIAPAAVGDYVRAAIPGSAFTQLSASGHVPLLSEPDEVVAEPPTVSFVTPHAGDAWFHTAPCGLIALTNDGLVADANDRFLSWVSLRAEDIIGRPFTEFLDAGSRLFFDTRVMQVVHLQGAADEVSLTLLTHERERLPVLVNAVADVEARLVRLAAFNASARHRYEADLLHARRAAESSEARVRVLQDVSSTFSLSASDEDVAQSFAAIAREAFDAREAAVLLPDEEGVLHVVGGVNPLEGRVAPVLELRNTPRVTVVDEVAARESHPELAAGMRDVRLTSLSITPLVAEDDRLGILVCFFGRRTEFDDHFYELQKALGRQASQTLVRVRLQRRLSYLALHDQLTGTANRELLQSRLDDAIENAQRSGEPLSVLFMDVDEFKAINDGFGHAAGDAVLVELARRLLAGVRGGDIIGRIGGDEFVTICADADIEAGLAIAERVLELTRTPIPVAAGVISASVSVGLTVYRPEIDQRPKGEQLLIRADGAMYESKDAGKDRVTLDEAQRA